MLLSRQLPRSNEVDFGSLSAEIKKERGRYGKKYFGYFV